MRIEAETREVKPGDAIPSHPARGTKIWNTGGEMLRLSAAARRLTKMPTPVITENALTVSLFQF